MIVDNELGPGQYNHDSTNKKLRMRFSKNFQLASGKREMKKDTDDNPGPGAYTEQKSFTMKKAPQYLIGKKL